MTLRLENSLRALALLWFALPAAAGGGPNGESASAELAFPASALAAAAGGASAGLVDDASAVWDNPARLGVAAPAGVAATHALWPLGMTDSQLAGYRAFAGAGVVGAQARVFRATIHGVAENGDGSYGGPAADVAYQTAAGTVAAALDPEYLRERTGIAATAGASITILQRSLAGSARNGLAGGAGVDLRWTPGFTTYAVGRHLGRMGRETLPLAGVMGVTGGTERLLGESDRVRGALEASWSREGGWNGAVAAEYVLRGERMEAALRLGYAAGTWGTAERAPTGGLALRWGALRLEGSYASAGALGWAPVISLSYQLEDGRN